MTRGRHRCPEPVTLRAGYARALVAAGVGSILAAVVVVAQGRNEPARAPAVVVDPTAVSTSSTLPAPTRPKPQAPPPPAPPPPPVVTPPPPVKRVESPRRPDWDDDDDRRERDRDDHDDDHDDE